MSKKTYIKPSMEVIEIEMEHKYALEVHDSLGGNQLVKGETDGTDDTSSSSWDTSSIWE